jgi:hypothetical protein
MRPIWLSVRLLIPVHDSGCTAVCVHALVRLATGLGLPFVLAMHTHWRFSSGCLGSSRQQTGSLTGGFSLPLPRA